jgi:hypothetical protein
LEKRIVVNQGDIYWVCLEGPDGSEPGYSHPQVVIQEDAINHSRVGTSKRGYLFSFSRCTKEIRPYLDTFAVF